MDTLNHNMNHTKSIKFNSIVHDTMKKLNGVHNNNATTMHSTINSSRSRSSGSNSCNSNGIKEDVRSDSEMNNNIHSDDDIVSSNQNNAKDHNSPMGLKIDRIQQPFDQKSAKDQTTNGYVNGHSNHNRCTIVQNFQNYHKPNR